MTRAPLPIGPRDYQPGVDGRQSEAAAEIQRGVQRMMRTHGLASITELTLKNGRRADVVGVTKTGEVWIVEIKSSVADLRADSKWPEYRDCCDMLFFAVSKTFPQDMIPEDTGLIIADRYGGEILRPAPRMALPAARRKTMLILVARAGADRLHLASDPDLARDQSVFEA